MAIKMTAKLKGVLTKEGQERYKKQLFNEKNRAIKASLPQATKQTKEAVAGRAKGVFDVKTRNFKNMFTSRAYIKKTDKLPGVLFYTRSPYFSIFEFGGKVRGVKGQGVLIPFAINGKAPYRKKKDFADLIDRLRKTKKAFFKKVRGNIILFVVADRSNSKSLTRFKKQYLKRENLKNGTNVKRVTSGTIIPIAIFKKQVIIKKRFNFTGIATQSFVPNLSREFDKNINLK